MIKEFSTPSPGQPPGPASSPVSPPEAPQLEVRGPAVRGDGGDQGKEPPGRNHIFPSTDVRSKDIRSSGDQRTTSAIYSGGPYSAFQTEEGWAV